MMNNSLRGLLVFVLSSMALFGACANDAKNPTPSPQARETITKAITKDWAAHIASNHLALKKRNWGEIENIVERDKEFHVYYPTPAQELRLLGPRVLIIDKTTGTAAVQKRR